MLDTFYPSNEGVCVVITLLWLFNIIAVKVLAKCILLFRSGIQLSGHFFKLSEVMGKNYQKVCGRTVFGIMFSLH